jgi:hypothetical protein
MIAFHKREDQDPLKISLSDPGNLIYYGSFASGPGTLPKTPLPKLPTESFAISDPFFSA